MTCNYCKPLGPRYLKLYSKIVSKGLVSYAKQHIKRVMTTTFKDISINELEKTFKDLRKRCPQAVPLVLDANCFF